MRSQARSAPSDGRRRGAFRDLGRGRSTGLGRRRSRAESLPVVDPLLAFDKLLGRCVERLFRSHHTRRLRRIGWEHALEPPDPDLWASGEPAPRAGCKVEVLIEGVEALPRLEAELRKARSHVHLAGWFMSPDFALVREPVRVELRTLLAELAERVPVRVLLWAGSPLPLFRPDRKDVARTLHALTSGTKIEAVADPEERPLHCHHEKIVLIDDDLALVGGIDLTTESGDRFDTNAHPARGELGWHDAACLLQGPIVTDLAAHFAQRWHDLTGDTLPEPSPSPPAGDVEVQAVRTVPEHVYEWFGAAISGSSSRTCADFVPRSASSTSRTSFSGRARSCRSFWTKSCSRPPTTSGF